MTFELAPRRCFLAYPALLRAMLTMSSALALAAAVAALARAEEAQIADVVVGAGDPGLPGELSKRKVEVLKIPRPIVVVDPKTAEREQLYNLRDFAQKLPSYNPGLGNPRTSRPAIRGVAKGAGAGDGSEFDTGFMVDNVFLKHVGFQWANFIDTESLEVALGPQGTNGGKNTTVGSIVIRTQLPSFQRKEVFETQFGNHLHVLQQFNATGPIIDDKLAYRIAAYYDKGDGYFFDQISGASMPGDNRWGVRGQLYYVGENFTDRLIFNYSASHEYNNSASGPIGDTSLIYANGTTPARSYFQNLQSRLGRSVLTLDPYKSLNTRLGTLDERQHLVSNELNVEVGRNIFTSITAFGKFRLLPRNTGGNNLTEITNTASNTYVEQFSQEFRLSSPEDQPVEWKVGLFSFYEYVWNRSYTNFGSDAAAWFSAPRLLRDMTNNRDGKARDLQIAAYGNATYHIDEQFSLTLGLRDSWEVRSGSNFSWNTIVPGNGTIVEQVDAIVAGGGQRFYDTGGQKATLNALTGIFNPQYKATENVTFYGLVGRGEKAGAVNTGAQAIFVGGVFQKFQPVITKPETSWDYEIGVKTNWFDETLIINANFYWNDLYNFQTNFVDTSVVDANGVPTRQTYLGTAKHARLRGFEFDGRWNAYEGLWVNFAGAITEPRWIDFDDAPLDAAWTWSGGTVAAPTQVSRSHSRFNDVPTFAFNVGFNYERPLGVIFDGLGDWANRPVTGFTYANVAWRDKSELTDPTAVIHYWQDAYALINLGFGVRTDDDRYSLNVWAKNIADVRPMDSFSPGTATSPTTIGLPDTVRTVGGTLRVKFF
ncbi:TonB-dependent receptor [Methylosinus sp. RM1]|uniref:TonB-dependent receptor n=1 Tax=Methylosinus sp. RM1 TaxID=2583817 RepID=UPI001FF05B34|nr:TonB-dependent receptor [Methylosinus sp. RM1]